MPTATPSLDTVFCEAIEIPDPDARAAYLDRACDPDVRLRERVGALVAAHFWAGDFLDLPVGPADVTTDLLAAPDADQLAAVGPGTVIGPYTLREQIGDGGMGLVFVAEQTHPVRRKVALKVIKPGMDTRQVVARFEAERQALALMDHPNIAKVHDGGSTDRGRPFFVMELVKGEPITDYCDVHQLTVRDRLGLFLQVCSAVQHAHQKAVIHRDLKPSNVLVSVHDVTAVAKVIDFGIAKALGQALTDKTVYTAVAQMLGTPIYMSPEQAGQSSLDVDTRTDVYALGVLLYELLTGTTPIDPAALRVAGYDEVRRMIQEDDPARPSARLSTLNAAGRTTVADRRGVNPRRLAGQIRGELDWVVMKCLEKDRNRRYESCGALAADLQRYLNDEPVEARPTSVGYRVRKFARRNRKALMTSGILAAAVLAVAASLEWGRRDTAAQRSAAEQASAAALTESADHFRAGRSEAALATARRAVDVLAGVSGVDEAAAAARDRVADLEMAARLEDVWLAGMDNGRFEAPETTAAAAHAAFRVYGLDPTELPETEAAERISRQLIVNELVNALDDWASNRRGLGGRDDPLAARLRSVAAAADTDPWRSRVRDVRTSGTPEQLAAMAAEIPVETASPEAVERLAGALARVGRRKDAEALLRRAARVYPDRVHINFRLGDLLKESPDEPSRLEALGYFRAALAVRPRSAVVMERIGVCLTDFLGRPAEGAEVFREVIRLRPDYVPARRNLAVALDKQGKKDEAVATAREAAAIAPGPRTYEQLGHWLGQLGRQDEAAEAYRQAVRFEPKTADEHHARGKALNGLGRRAEAIHEYRAAVRLRPLSADAHHKLGWELAEIGADEEAMAAYLEALRQEPDSAITYNGIGVLHMKRGRLEEAADAYRKAILLKPDYPAPHFYLSLLLKRLDRFEEAATECRAAIRLGPTSVNSHYNLGAILSALDRTDEAVEAYRAAIRLKPTYAEAHCNLGHRLMESGKYGEALAEYRSGHEYGSKDPKWPYPSNWWIEIARRVVALESRIEAIQAGKETPADSVDALAVADVSRWQKRNVRAAELYLAAFTHTPRLAEDLATNHRYNAACVAAQAGGGQGKDGASLMDRERAEWRHHALVWLRAELAARKKVMVGGNPESRLQTRTKLSNWQKDRDLAGVRDVAALAKLPDGEQADWAQFWADVKSALVESSDTRRGEGSPKMR